MLAIYAFLTAGLIFYGYMRRNRYLDVLLASIGVGIVGISLVLSAFGFALAFARLLFSFGTFLAIVVAVLLGIRLFSGAYKTARKQEQKSSEAPTQPDDEERGKSQDDENKAA